MNAKDVRAPKILFCLLMQLSLITALSACQNDNVRFSNTPQAELSKAASGTTDTALAPTIGAAKSASYDVPHANGSVVRYTIDLAVLNNLKSIRRVSIKLINQSGDSGTVSIGSNANRRYLTITTTATGNGATLANYSLTTNGQTSSGQITFNVICTDCSTNPLLAKSVDTNASHNYNSTSTSSVDVKTLSGVGNDAAVTVSILQVTGTLNGGVAVVAADKINYTTGPLQNNNEDIVIEYQLKRGTEMSSALIRVDVTCLPDCITPKAESLSVNVILPTTGPVLTNIPLNIEGGSITITQAPTKGTATASGNSIQFTPNIATSGADQIIYRVDKKLNGTSLASSTLATISITIEPENTCVDICDGRPLSVTISFTPPKFNTDGSAINEGGLAGYNVFSEKYDRTENANIGAVTHVGTLSQQQSGKFNIDYTRFTNYQSMTGICFRATAKNLTGQESAQSAPTPADCKIW